MLVYLSLGTNLGDKEQNLRQALTLLEQRLGSVVACSSFYATAPWGFVSDNAFLNAACAVDTSLSPHEILAVTRQIEQEMGRAHKSVNGIYSDRLIDIDLLLCGNTVLDTPDLQLPHPLMHLRRFVLEPLAEIAPDLQHPLLKLSMSRLLDSLPEVG